MRRWIKCGLLACLATMMVVVAGGFAYVYTLDLDAGTVTFSDPLNLSGYTLPLKIRGGTASPIRAVAAPLANRRRPAQLKL